MSNFRVMEPALDATTVHVNGKAVLLNILLLYGYAATTYIVPTLCGVAYRGFFCDDDSIRYEYRDDTVSTKQLFMYNLVLNAFTIFATEYYRINQVENAITQPKYRWRNSHLHVLFVRIITYFGYSQIGFVVNLSLNVVTKHVIGRLRPHFIAVCAYNNSTCASGSEHSYILNYTCSGAPELVLEARKSFYSGHSAISLYCAVWSALYIQARLAPLLHNRIIVPILQNLMLIMALGISYSRITDNKHHWSDVLVGVFAGSFIAIYTCVFWTQLFKSDEGETAPLIVTPQYTTDLRPSYSRNEVQGTSRSQEESALSRSSDNVRERAESQ